MKKKVHIATGRDRDERDQWFKAIMDECTPVAPEYADFFMIDLSCPPPGWLRFVQYGASGARPCFFFDGDSRTEMSDHDREQALKNIERVREDLRDVLNRSRPPVVARSAEDLLTNLENHECSARNERDRIARAKRSATLARVKERGEEV